MDNELRERIERSIPEHVKPGLVAYVEEGQPPGGFLRAVLENDLYGAFAKADPTNVAMMVEYARVLEFMPPGSWGNRANVKAWIENRGLSGRAA